MSAVAIYYRANFANLFSGQQVLGPGDDAAKRLFDAARRAGAEQINPEEHEEAMGSSGRVASQVQGGAYRLGGHGVPSEQLSAGAAPRENPNAPVLELSFYGYGESALRFAFA